MKMYPRASTCQAMTPRRASGSALAPVAILLSSDHATCRCGDAGAVDAGYRVLRGRFPHDRVHKKPNRGPEARDHGRRDENRRSTPLALRHLSRTRRLHGHGPPGSRQVCQHSRPLLLRVGGPDAAAARGHRPMFGPAGSRPRGARGPARRRDTRDRARQATEGPGERRTTRGQRQASASSLTSSNGLVRDGPKPRGDPRRVRSTGRLRAPVRRACRAWLIPVNLRRPARCRGRLDRVGCS
jgi:hypothetical protein